MPDSGLSSHPGAEQLKAFALGNLADAHKQAVQEHLARCSACRTALAALPNGTDGHHRPESSTTSDAGHGAAPAQQTGPQLPAGLVNHGRYEVLQLLGEGGMGAVYKARHRKMDRLVALKIIHARFVDNPTTIERFYREVQAAARLDHPNIVRAFDADQAGNTHFLAMELVEGTDLAQYIQKKGPLSVSLACHFIRQAALGLQHAHERGMVHRDIKPHNLMLTRASGGRPGESAARSPVLVKIMDFGLARLACEGGSESGLTGENVLMGTADYIAPEQAQDAHNADIRADIYSLGCTLYHLLAGKPPFAGVGAAQKIAGHLGGNVSLAGLPATIPDNLRAVLARMVEKNPARRYQAPGEVAQSLTPFLKNPAKATPEAAEVRRPVDEPAPSDGLGTQAVTEERRTSIPQEAKAASRCPSWGKRMLVAVPLLLMAGLATFLLHDRSGKPVEDPPSDNGQGAGLQRQPVLKRALTLWTNSTRHKFRRQNASGGSDGNWSRSSANTVSGTGALVTP